MCPQKWQTLIISLEKWAKVIFRSTLHKSTMISAPMTLQPLDFWTWNFVLNLALDVLFDFGDAISKYSTDIQLYCTKRWGRLLGEEFNSVNSLHVVEIVNSKMYIEPPYNSQNIGPDTIDQYFRSMSVRILMYRGGILAWSLKRLLGYVDKGMKARGGVIRTTNMSSKGHPDECHFFKLVVRDSIFLEKVIQSWLWSTGKA